MFTVKKSHPAWVCGLKQEFTPITEIIDEVTPCVGVWIETGSRTFYSV